MSNDTSVFNRQLIMQYTRSKLSFCSQEFGFLFAARFPHIEKPSTITMTQPFLQILTPPRLYLSTRDVCRFVFVSDIVIYSSFLLCRGFGDKNPPNEGFFSKYVEPTILAQPEEQTTQTQEAGQEDVDGKDIF